MLGLEKLWPYLHSRHVENFDDWSAIPLDDEGKNLQAEMNDKFVVSHLTDNFLFLFLFLLTYFFCRKCLCG